MEDWTPKNYKCIAQLSGRLDEIHKDAEAKNAHLKDKQLELYQKKDKAEIQKLLQLPQLDLTLVKKYAELFQEWDEITKLGNIKI